MNLTERLQQPQKPAERLPEWRVRAEAHAKKYGRWTAIKDLTLRPQ